MNINFLQFENDGKELVCSNYWQTEQSKAGLFYMSVNAGAIRMLIPTLELYPLSDMTSSTEVVVTVGTMDWRYMPEAGEGRRMIEILFDDHSDRPFALHTSLNQWDRVPSRKERSRWVDFTGWRYEGGDRPVKVLERMALIRFKPLPCLKAARRK